MVAKLDLSGIPVEVVRKDIKNVHLSVYPPTGAVRISAPLRMNLDTIRVFAISKLAWIRQQQKQIAAQERETPREFLERESHYVWGRRNLLKLLEKDAPPQIELKHRQLVLQIRPGTSQKRDRPSSKTGIAPNSRPPSRPSSPNGSRSCTSRCTAFSSGE